MCRFVCRCGAGQRTKVTNAGHVELLLWVGVGSTRGSERESGEQGVGTQQLEGGEEEEELEEPYDVVELLVDLGGDDVDSRERLRDHPVRGVVSTW